MTVSEGGNCVTAADANDSLNPSDSQSAVSVLLGGCAHTTTVAVTEAVRF